MTEADFGVDSYVPGKHKSSHVAGAIGEAILNFGPLGVPFVFILLGLLVGEGEALVRRLCAGDSRTFIVAWFPILACVMLMSDSDNDLFFLFEYLLLPALLLAICSRKRRLRRAVLIAQ